MKRYILILTLLCVIIPVFAAGGGDRIAPYTPRLFKIKTEAQKDSLESEGVEILRRRGNILLCLFPNTPTRSGEEKATRSRPIAPTLDIARTYYEAASIQNGTATGNPYTGKGVVVGLCDIGLDPLHPTFLDADGKSRIKKVVHYVENEGIRLELEGDEAYRQWATDNPDEYHATHVCGILAGGGAGTEYTGIAYDSEIVATVSTLTEVGLLAGVEDIIDYAKEVGKPAVINISVGSYTGPHDGSTLFSQYLDMCGDDAIIVLSSGNEGNHRNTLMSDFTDSRRKVIFRLGDKSWLQNNMYGVTDIWSGQATPLTVTLGLYDSDERKILRWLEPMILTGGESRTFEWDGDDSAPDALPFDGELTAVGYVDEENGRHCTTLGYEFASVVDAAGGGWSRYELAVEVDGEPGNDVEVYSDGIYTRLSGYSGSPAPTTERTTSDLACGFNVISVGMYGNRDTVPHSHPEAFQDNEIIWDATGYQAGATVVHSSYGTLRDGRITPSTVAPGAKLMSAGSRPFFERYPFTPHFRTMGTTWTDEGGTSMSAPYVAGYIATWLEAVPTLTIGDVQRIIRESNRFDIADAEDPRNASGYFDPVKGLRLALQSGGVESAESIGELDPAAYIEVFDLAGVKRYAGAASGLSGIEKGIYVVKGPRSVFKLKI